MVLYIGIPLAILLFVLLYFLRKRANASYSTGRRIANTDLVRNSDIYKKKERTFKTLFMLRQVFAGLMIASCLVMMARPFITTSQSNGAKKRDIYLCLDVSYSLYDQNAEIVDSLVELVKGLDGDRFGISIFNTSSVVYVPMTDDYDYVIDKLGELKQYFVDQKRFEEICDEYYYIDDMPQDIYDEYYELVDRLSYIQAGTLYDSDTKGSSLIGEGLASCMYSFPQLESSERTRVVILSTDNDQSASKKPLVELEEAVKLCQKHDITVFTIAPTFERFWGDYEPVYDLLMNDLKVNTLKTGGEFYVAGSELSVPDVVSSIQSHEAMAVKSTSMRIPVDQPQMPFAVFLLAFLGFAVTGRVLKR